MPRGGKRPGAGHPKGPTGPTQATISKIEAREMVRKLVLPHLASMVESQVANANGLKYLVLRNKKTGKFVRVTEAMAKLLNEGSETEHESVEIWEKDPSVQAFTDLLNRTLDKPAEQEQAVAVSGDLNIKWQE